MQPLAVLLGSIINMLFGAYVPDCLKLMLCHVVADLKNYQRWFWGLLVSTEQISWSLAHSQLV